MKLTIKDCGISTTAQTSAEILYLCSKRKLNDYHKKCLNNWNVYFCAIKICTKKGNLLLSGCCVTN